jgi:predicted nucleic acid-binding protein
MAQYLLDTDTCIAFLKGKNNLLDKIENWIKNEVK